MSTPMDFVSGLQDYQRNKLNNQQTLAAIASQNAQTEQMQVNTEAKQLDLQRQQRMLELMQQYKPPSEAQQVSDSGDQFASQLDNLAQLALEAGLPEQAREYASTGSTIRNNASLAADRLHNQRLKDLEISSNLLREVTDQASWQQANGMYEMLTGKKSPFGQMEYSPELAEQISNALVSEKEAIETQLAQQRIKASEQTVKESQVRVRLLEAQTAESKTREANLKKVGSSAAAPKNASLQAITDLISSKYGAVGAMPEDIRTIARPVAERMEQLMREQNLPASQAAQKAFSEAQENNQFSGLMERARLAGSPYRPIKLTPGMSAKDMRTNMVYEGLGQYAGQMFRWDGSKLVRVDPSELGIDPNEVKFEEEEEE